MSFFVEGKKIMGTMEDESKGNSDLLEVMCSFCCVKPEIGNTKCCCSFVRLTNSPQFIFSPSTSEWDKFSVLLIFSPMEWWSGGESEIGPGIQGPGEFGLRDFVPLSSLHPSFGHDFGQTFPWSPGEVPEHNTSGLHSRSGNFQNWIAVCIASFGFLMFVFLLTIFGQSGTIMTGD